MLQEREMKNWVIGIENLKEKIKKNLQELETQKKDLISEIIGYFNDEIGYIRGELIKLGFEDNKDHFSHVVNVNPEQDDSAHFYYARWQIYLGKAKELTLFIDLSGNKDDEPLDRMPNFIHFNIPKLNNYYDAETTISVESLYALFDKWLEKVSSKITVEDLRELLKIKLSLP